MATAGTDIGFALVRESYPYKVFGISYHLKLVGVSFLLGFDVPLVDLDEVLNLCELIGFESCDPVKKS